MNRVSRWAIALLVLLTAVPLVVYGIAMLFLPETVPLHFGFDGTPNRWGSKYELLVVGAILSGVNVICALCYVFAPALKRMGLLNAPKNNDVGIARVILLISAGIIDVVSVAIIMQVYLVAQAAA